MEKTYVNARFEAKIVSKSGRVLWQAEQKSLRFLYKAVDKEVAEGYYPYPYSVEYYWVSPDGRRSEIYEHTIAD